MAEATLKEALKDKHSIDTAESKEDFASMLDEHEKKAQRQGDLRNGKIVSINDKDGNVMVDVGEKKEGRIKIEEIKDTNGNLLFQVGDTLQVLFMGVRGGEYPDISYKKAIKYSKLQNYIKALGSDYADKIIEGVVVASNKGGYLVESEGVELFLPKHQAAFKKDTNPKGKKIKVCILNVKPEENSVILSRKRLLDLEQGIKKEAIERIVKEDKILEGIVRNIASFGIFVEVPIESNGKKATVDGLVHFTEISHKGSVNPAKLYKEGDKVTVKPIAYDCEKGKLSFSIKALLEDPWEQIQSQLEVGDAIAVNVSKIEDYGAFVDLGNDLEGFLHISELSWDKNIKHPSECLKEGQDIDVEVIEIDTQKKRLRVSLKKLQAKPFEQFLKSHKEGDIVKGKIVSLTDFGAFIKVGSVDGLLHNEDAFWQKGQTCKEAFQKGQEIEVKIAHIDKEKEKVSLSRKGIIPSPTEEFAKKHKVDEIIEGKIRDIKDFGVFIQLDGGMEALIRTEDLYPLKKDELKVGDSIKAVLSNIDTKENRIRASVKRLERQQEREHLKSLNESNNDRMTLGDMIKNAKN